MQDLDSSKMKMLKQELLYLTRAIESTNTRKYRFGGGDDDVGIVECIIKVLQW